MNQIIDGIKQRRSCRNYESKQIDDEVLNEILECGLLAPSGMNQQGIHFTVIQKQSLLAELKEMVGRDFIYDAPTLIIVHADDDYPYVQTDGSTALENMYIAANASQLGACWINQLKDYHDHELLKRIGLANQTITGSLALGYPSEAPTKRELNKNRVTIIK